MTATRRSLRRGQGDFFAAEPRLPPGFAYREALIAAGEERALVERFAELPFQPFEFHGYLGKRRIVSFGWRYDYGGRALRESQPIPSFLLRLREQVAAFAEVPAEGVQQILVTEYAPGAGIGWHRDKPMFEDVVAVSFLSSCVLRFRRKQGTGWERVSREISARSAYLLRGPARREWEHSVPPVDRLRYSVTFRNFVTGDARRREEAQ
ncbi:MAG TPA: alpha-ketoglutarate-dependent dioxygenase AlkB [Stellaceae bacterium]|jgi:alkylated DNA repair dioxygenase AlkB|nr:alpha-ketoglutarate-dependent dioxygenase AlkB [Stellaceae bacterium]